MNWRACPWQPGIKEHKSAQARALGKRERESFFASVGEKGNLIMIDCKKGGA